jgi:hypothetical protein
MLQVCSSEIFTKARNETRHRNVFKSCSCIEPHCLVLGGVPSVSISRTWRNSLKHCISIAGLRLALSKGPKRVGVSFPAPEKEIGPVYKTPCFRVFIFNSGRWIK